MHIAICDDNIADRKHTERLLGREADKRRKSSALYIDSFGHVDALLRAPMIYDAFFLDYHSEELTVMDLADRLRHAGVTAPIFICQLTSDGESDSSITPISIDTETPLLSMELYQIYKPLQPATLCQALDHAASLMGKRVTPLEIRSKDTTHYLNKDEILYIDARKSGMELYRSDGGVIHLFSTFHELCHTFENHHEFIYVGHSYIVNAAHVKQITLTKIILSNGVCISIPFSQSGTLKKILKELKEDGIL